MEPGTIYHVFNRSNGNELMFKSESDYLRFKFLIAKYLLFPGIIDLYAYCLLPNHFHLLLSPREIIIDESQKIKPISQIFSNMFNSYAKYFNNKHKRKGSMFMRPFRRKALKSEFSFGKLTHYIHVNPVHHGYCKSILEWDHSSYSEYLEETRFITKKNMTLEWFGGLDEFIKFHSSPILRKINGVYVEESNLTG